MRRKFNSNIVVYLKDTYSFNLKVKVNKFTINFNSNCLFIEMFTQHDIRLGGRNTWSNGFNPLLSVVLYILHGHLSKFQINCCHILILNRVKFFKNELKKEIQ
jgi:hypothetical protein